MWLFNPKDETIVLIPNHQVDSYIKEKGTKFFKFNLKPTFGELEEARRKFRFWPEDDSKNAADYAMHCKIIHIESGDIRISKKAPFNFKIKRVLMSAYCKSIKK